MPSDHYRIEELARLFKSHGPDQVTEASVNAGLLTFLSSGHLQQRKPNEQDASTASVAKPATSSPEGDLVPKNYYKRLDVEADATILDIRRAFQARIAELDSRHETADQQTIARHAYEEAEIILTDRMTRQAYDESLAAKVDFVEHGLAARILAEHFRKEGERRLRDRSYEDARNAFERALKYESNDEVRLQSHWASFLDGEQTQERADFAVEQMKGLEGGQLGHDRLYLYYGKVLRLCGDLEAARNHLNKAVEFNKDNQEAWGELRLLNSAHAKRGQTAMKISLSADSLDVRAVVIYSFICLGLMYGLAHFVPSERTEWPMVDNQQLVNQTQSDNEYQTLLAQQLRDRIEQERSQSKMIPPNKRVWVMLNTITWQMTAGLWRDGLCSWSWASLECWYSRTKGLSIPRLSELWLCGDCPALRFNCWFSFLRARDDHTDHGITRDGPLTALAEHVFFFDFLVGAC